VDRAGLASAIHAVSHRTGRFTLRSGRTAEEYFDKFQFTSDPVLLAAVAAALADLLPEGAEVVAGLELGGVPLAAALSLHTGLPAAYVRKERKTYGTCLIAEGAPVAGRHVAVVEDVVTTGGQLLSSIEDLTDEGAVVVAVLAVLDRESGGRDAIEAAGFDYRALFTLSDLTAGSSG
jgi:orotate phosphoribosyltransferase